MNNTSLASMLPDDLVDRLGQEWPPFTHPLFSASHLRNGLNVNRAILFWETILDPVGRDVFPIDTQRSTHHIHIEDSRTHHQDTVSILEEEPMGKPLSEDRLES
jgi:hypothetical protein